MTPPAEPRPAATVVVLRPSADRFEVLLLRRNDQVAFMAGAYVFPGGRVDAGDYEGGSSAALPGGRSRFGDLSAASELPFRRAAARELLEEAALRVSIDELIPIAHWVTPDIETRRYDTRFFLTPMPSDQEARHDEGETVALVWASPGEALERCRRGEIMLPPPTWTTLRQLERHASFGDALDWARITPIVRVQPQFVREGTARVLTLPGDPSFATVPGWTVPEETRFVLEEGRGWSPVRT